MLGYVTNKLDEYKYSINAAITVGGIAYVLYDVYNMKIAQRKLEQVLDDTIERLKTMDLEIENIALFIKDRYVLVK